MQSLVSPSTDNRIVMTVSSLAFALVLVLVLSTPLVEMTNALRESQKVYRLYGYGALALLQIALVPMRGWQRTQQIMMSPVSLFLLWCALSLAWTQHLDLTAKRLVLLVLVYGGIVGSVFDLGSRRSLGIVRIILVVVLVLNFAAAVAIPEFGMQFSDGKAIWRGFMGHKNIAGMVCAVTVIFFTFDSSKVPIAARGAVIFAALVFLALAQSKTAWVTLPLGLAAGGAVVLLSRRGVSAEAWHRPVVLGSIAILALVIAGLIVATLQQDALLSLTDNTQSLTGRTAIWRPMIQFYLDHPLLGAGYGAYWDASGNLIDTHIVNSGVWKDVDQGHNGYLDLLTQVGLPGLALALYAAFVWPTKHLIAMTGKSPQLSALCAALLTFLLVENFSESSLFADDTIGNAFLIIAIAYVQRFTTRGSIRPRNGKGDDLIDAARRHSSARQRNHGAGGI